MKILWITNTPLGPLGQALGGKRANGVWMDALSEDFKQHCEHQLVIATTGFVDRPLHLQENGISYYALPNTPPILYNETRPGNIAAWRTLLETEQPNVIQVWGTEFTHGLCALRVAKELNIPAVIYMQGYLGSIARHYFAGISYPELRKTVTFRDFVKRDSIIQQKKKYEYRSQKEREMLSLAGRIISENTWCDMSIAAIVPAVKIYHCPLSINHVFTQYSWKYDCCEPHSIICNASGYPLKGLHMVLRALNLLKRKYPDVKLYVPGEKQVSDGSVQWLLRKRGYTKYIEMLIKKLDLSDHIIWLGNLSQEALAEQYAKTSVFILASSIENHSSSLKEAMMVGVPSIASSVGGVPEYVKHGENGFLYRFEEYDILAGYVAKIFENQQIAQNLSACASESMKQLHINIDMYNTAICVYNDILAYKKE